MNGKVEGIHHITAFCGEPQANVDFYADLLGLRMAKVSVNQDDPGTYHLFYGDAEGSPGSAITFFSWPTAYRGKPGTRQAMSVAYSVPEGSLDFWQERFSQRDVHVTESTRFDQRLLTVIDPEGFVVELVESSEADDPRPARPWHDIPAEAAIKGFHSVTLSLPDTAKSSVYLVDQLGFQTAGVENGRERFIVGEGHAHQIVDLVANPDAPTGRDGVGTIHHVAFRLPDDASHRELRDAIAHAGYSITDVIDRFWFKSAYTREPGGVLYEIATDVPGFHVDEDMEKLGQTLVLPPWLEEDRARIVQRLPAFTTPEGIKFP